MRKKKKVSNNFERSSTDYFIDISKCSPIPRNEENDLWEKYKNENDLLARDKIVKSNLHFVASVAKSYLGMGLSYPELIAEGNLGLMKAMDKFDYKRGNKTISYAVWWIKQAILEALDKKNLIKGDDSEFNKEIVEDDFDYGEQFLEPCDEKYMDDTDSVRFNTAEEISAVQTLMGCLTEKEADVIKYYFGLDNNDELTLEEIGKIFNLTKERIRQIKENALKKLRTEALKKSITSEIYK
jgi:RNA polymerase primary sigma factor